MEVKYGQAEIKSLLDKARIFNNQIGEYECFTITTDFEYVVKLTNGTIWFELIDLQRSERFEQTPDSLKLLASRYKTKDKHKPGVLDGVGRASLSRNTLGWSLVSFMLLMGLIGGGISLGNRVGLFVEPSTNSEKEPATDKPLNQPYEHQVRSLAEMEKAHPARFMFAEIDYRLNIWRTKFKLDVKVLNKAKSAAFKNAVLRLSYLDENKRVIKNEHKVLEEQFPPGSNTPLSFKVKVPEDAAGLKWQIIDAKPL